MSVEYIPEPASRSKLLLLPRGHEARVRAHTVRIQAVLERIRQARACSCGGRRYWDSKKQRDALRCARCGSKAFLPRDYK